MLVLDLNMPGELEPAGDPAPARALARHGHRRADDAGRPGFAREALQAGALGFVLKEAADEELLEASASPAAGDTYLNPRLGARLAAAPAGPPARPTTSASARSRSCG